MMNSLKMSLLLIFALLAVVFTHPASAAGAMSLSSSELALRLVSGPRAFSGISTPLLQNLSPYCIQAMRVAVGPPRAELALDVVNPVKKVDTPANGQAQACAKADLDVNPRILGTVVLLPGYGIPKSALLPYADALAKNGFRAILVDLRGQGESTGQYIGFIWRDASDLNQAIATLRKQGDIVGHLGLFGISYGASVALEASARDHEVKVVVAVAPFARVAPTIKRFIELSDPGLAKTISKSTWAAAIKKAGVLEGFPLSLGNPHRVVARIQARVLYIAGSQDHVAPLRDIRTLAASTPGAQLVIEPGENHIMLSSNAPLILRTGVPWLEKALKAGASRPSAARLRRSLAHGSAN
jgi:pimeloyl-ACP methyl ester carboxylesterase